MKIETSRLSEFDTELINELTEIEAEAFGDGGLNRWTFPVLIRHGVVYVIKCDGKTCGVADVIKDWVDPGLAFLINFVVRKDERGKGFGLRFMRDVVEDLRRSDIRKVQLTVDPANERAINLYERIGFTKIAELPEEYGPSDDRLLYELELEE